MTEIRTERLKLMVCGPVIAKAAASADLADRAGLPVTLPDAWPEQDLKEFLPVLVEQMEQEPATAVWAVWLMVGPATNRVMGDLGFKGPPDADGQVEIGYGILPEHRRQGYAFEAVQALVDWAFRERSVSAVLAECLDDNIGSIRILEKLGMERLTPEGNMLKWVLRRQA